MLYVNCEICLFLSCIETCTTANIANVGNSKITIITTSTNCMLLL